MKQRFLRLRRTAALVMAATMTLGLTACGTASSGGTSTEGSASEATETASATPASDYDDGTIRSDLTALEVVNLMGNGINLGNTMEACSNSNASGLASSVYETSWGMPLTTQEMITAMKEAGFDTLRIPVAWLTNATDYQDGDYTINEEYLDRVEEIVNYARSAGMYVIINDHWDGGWWGMFGSSDEETREEAMEIYVSMWTQIATRFADYSDYVIFESANEELGYSLNESTITGEDGVLTDDECYEMTNEINQTFVDTVRSTGGNNAERFLLIAGFGTDIASTCDDRYEMPTDTADSKLLLSVHFYDPSGYTIFTSVSTWGNEDEYTSMNETLEMMTQYTEQGYGIVIGEYGVLYEGDNELKDNALEYYTNFLANCDLYGYCPVLWSCNDTFNRDDLCIEDEELAAMFLEYSYDSQSSMTEEEIAEAAQATLDDGLANASSGGGVDSETAIAWIMFNDSDWGMLYSVGDEYDSTSMTEGVVANDVEITGEGSYTVSLDFTGTEKGYGNSVVFSAVGIANGEYLFPGYYIENVVVEINGEEVELLGDYYTTSDDGTCTRVNLYNSWVSALPDDARRLDGDLSNATPCLLDAESLGQIYTISVTFDYVAGE